MSKREKLLAIVLCLLGPMILVMEYLCMISTPTLNGKLAVVGLTLLMCAFVLAAALCAIEETERKLAKKEG